MFTEFDCPEDGLCSNQGTCDDTIGSCVCDDGFEGSICKGKNTDQLLQFQFNLLKLHRNQWQTVPNYKLYLFV